MGSCSQPSCHPHHPTSLHPHPPTSSRTPFSLIVWIKVIYGASLTCQEFSHRPRLFSLGFHSRPPSVCSPPLRLCPWLRTPCSPPVGSLQARPSTEGSWREPPRPTAHPPHCPLLSLQGPLTACNTHFWKSFLESFSVLQLLEKMRRIRYVPNPHPTPQLPAIDPHSHFSSFSKQSPPQGWVQNL